MEWERTLKYATFSTAALMARYPGIWDGALSHSDVWPRAKFAAEKMDNLDPMPADVLEAFCDCLRGDPAQ
ncbi:MAG: hypothetical protein JO108_13545 [Acidobacteriaceae bacterium]|nr:hypothetical protein [Acidobacteriaceae bacterium]